MDFDDEDSQEYRDVQSTLPDGYTIRKVAIDRKTARKYRLTIAVTSAGDADRLKWRSRWITKGKPRARLASAERECIDELSLLTWLDLQAMSATAEGVPSAPTRDGMLRDAAPEPGSLKEPGVGGTRKRPRNACWGGTREGAGRMKGSVGKRATRERAIALRQQLTQAIPDAFELSCWQLEEALAVWKEIEPELVDKARKKFLNKGYSQSQALKKMKRARDAEARVVMRDVVAHDFREEQLKYFAKVRRDAAVVISASAVEEEDDVPSAAKSLSNYQRGEIVVHALTLAELYRQQNDGVDRETALQMAAETGFCTPDTVREWERSFLARGHIKVSAAGRFQRNFLLGLDNSILTECKDWTRAWGGILKGQANKTAEDFRQFVNTDIMPKIEALMTPDYDPFKGLRVNLVEVKKGEPKKRHISIWTATAWLKKLGCEYHQGKGGLYFDGHDDEKVLEYRNDTYLPELFKTRDYMEVWIPMEERVTSKLRYEDGKMALLCYQDESIFRANDDQKAAWWAPDVHVVRKKSPGQGIMVSGTIIHNVGFVSATKREIKSAEQLRRKRCNASAAAAKRGENVKVEVYRRIDKLYVDEEGNYWSYHLFEYGKNKEGYWTGLKMLDHMSDVIDMLAIKYPNHKPVGLFDWSSCHDCLEEGAPTVKRMNVGHGGKRQGEEIAGMDAVTLREDTPNLGKGSIQHLVFQPGDDPPMYAPHLAPAEYVGKLKGMRQILWERGLLKDGMSKSGGSGTKQDLSMSMEHVLGEQKDFKEVESSLALLMARHGGFCIMLPKYHCECNPIELVWGRAKDWTRKHCNYSLDALRENVPLSFRVEPDRQAVGTVQAYCKKSYTHNLVYRDTRAVGPEGEKHYQTYKSHRRPAPSEYKLKAANAP
ncbi:unnamed protein product [Ectocarpus sp. CCAP 1310/34]|nr:unnamed protein product [Ectocarpus sp. CCAP 1310/34]